MVDWLAGVAEWDITPPLGVFMTGYAGRPGPADHVLDRLSVRALAIGAPGEAPVVLTCGDLLGIAPELVAAIRAGLADVLPAERLLLNHSHTHAGPATAPLRAMGQSDPAYCDLVVRWTISAVREALRTMRPARLAFGTAPTRIGINRRELRGGRMVLGDFPEGAYDPTVYVLRVEEAAGRPLACWLSHATHPVVMGNENTGLSAEWPGIAAGVIARELGAPAVFAQGCCGDINPARRGGYAVVRSVGRELAGAALVAWERAAPVEASGPALGAALETVLLPQRKPEPVEAERALDAAGERLRDLEAQHAAAAGSPEARSLALQAEVARMRVGWAEDFVLASREDGSPAAALDVQALRIGDVLLTATSAETFIEIGQAIQAAAPTPRAVALGYTNGCLGYLPTAKAFPLGGYEIETAYQFYGTLMLTPDCERLTLAAAERVNGAVWVSG